MEQQNKQPKELQLEILINQHLILGKPLAQVARDMNVSPNVIYRLVQTEEFELRKTQLKNRFGAVNENYLQGMETEMQKMLPLVMTRFRDILESSLDDRIVSRVGDSILDRVGLSRQQRVESHHVLDLSPDAAKLLSTALAEQEALEIPRSDWSYAHERPTDTRTRLLSQRATPPEVEREGTGEHFLHGEGDHRLQGSRSGRARDDGQVDPERGEAEVGFSPARSLEDVSMDDS